MERIRTKSRTEWKILTRRIKGKEIECREEHQ
jgi:hypothetical protein